MRKVLLCTVGLSPQVVTETLYALDRQDNWIPDQLVLVTTRSGGEGCRHLLLDRHNGALYRYAKEWRAPWARKLAEQARLEIVDTDSGDLDASRATLLFASRIAEIISEICDDQDTQLHVSLAGGRKPASALVTQALSLYGRPQDKLSHVLVPDNVTLNPSFFYPPPEPQMMAGRDGGVMDASATEVQLFEIPYVRLRRFVPEGNYALDEMIQQTSKVLSDARLVIDLPQGCIFWDGKRLSFPPNLAAWLAWLAAAQFQNGNAGLDRVGSPLAEFIKFYRRFASPRQVQNALSRTSDPLDPEWMEEKASRVAKLASDCGIRPRGARLVQRTGPRAHAIYRLALDASEIRVVPVLEQAGEPQAQ